MKLIIDISKDCYDTIMARDWKNAGWLFSEELKAIHDGKIIEQEPCEDCISRQAVLDATVNKNSIWNKITNSKGENLEEIISQLPPVNSQEPKTDYKSFCECVAEEIFDENWEYNKDTFAELACRRLAKL